MSQKSRVERDGVGCYGKRTQKRLWNKVVAASFGGLGEMLGVKAGCGRVSEEVGTLNLMLGSCLLSMTLLVRCPINWVVWREYFFQYPLLGLLAVHLFEPWFSCKRNMITQKI